jgi:hypothetical protein
MFKNINISSLLLKVAIVLVVAVLTFGVVAYFVYPQLLPSFVSDFVNEIKPERESVDNYGLDFGGKDDEISSMDISGRIYISSRPEESHDDGTVPINFYYVDISDETPDTFTQVNYPLNNSFIDFKSKTEGVYALTLTTMQVTDDFYMRGIFDYDSVNDTYKEIIDTEERVIRQISWSEPAQRIVYAYQDEVVNYDDLLDSDEWNITILDPATNKEQIIGSGQYPLWSPDGEQVMYVNKSGLRVYDLEQGTDQMVPGVDLSVSGMPVIGTVMLGVSPDGRYMAWSNPSRNLIAIFEIVTWGEEVTVREVGRIQSAISEYYWPVFSPDSEFYVVQAIDNEQGVNELRTNPRYEIRSVLDRSIIKTIDLSEFYFMEAFTDDWIL